MKLALALLAAGVATAGAEPLPTSELHLTNGATVILAPDPTLADVVVHVRVPAGTADGDAAELVLRAIDTLDPKLDALGGWSTAQVARDHTSYTLQIPGEALGRALFLEAERFAHVTPDAALATRADLERDRAALAGTRASLVAHALDGPSAAASRATIATLLQARYAPANLLVVIAGGFDARSAHDAVTRYFGALRPVSAAPPDPAATASGTTGVLHDRVRDRVMVAFAMPLPLTSARLDLDVAARVLTARLRVALATTDVRVDPPFAIDAPEATREAILAALRDLRDAPITADELARATAMLELDQVTALEGLAYRTQAIADAAVYAHSPHYLEAWRGRLAAVTAASVQATARTWLAASRATIVVGDAP